MKRQTNVPNVKLQEFTIKNFGSMRRVDLIEQMHTRFGISQGYASTYISRLSRRGLIVADNHAALRQVEVPPVKGRSTSELFARFDDVGSVTVVLESIPQGQYLTDEEIRRAAKVSMDRWKSPSLQERISKWRYTLPNRKVVWMSPADQKELTNRINNNY